MRLHQQTLDLETPLKAALMGLVQLMGKGTLRRRLPWNRLSIIKNNKIMDNFIKAQIESIHLPSRNIGQGLVVADLVVTSKERIQPSETSTSKRDLPVRNPSMDHVQIMISNIKALLFAGHDTTASTICFLFKCLQDNPNCLFKLREEHDIVIGPDPEKAAETIRSAPHLLHQLPYTLAIIKETLRMYPIASTIREGISGISITVPDSTIQYPLEGFAPWIAISVLQQDPQIWPRPLEFLPERWIVPKGHDLFPPKDAWIPFSLGKSVGLINTESANRAPEAHETALG